ncbi:MAG TPA: dual specificity protein phosphatase family protein [Pyrinomonadaceae bacterium]|jgi:protein tyrosine/serine phosphatase|nr:dual specificity protein phosphatase family protein [Pyrinomonadaceae bacterium]
MKLSRRISPLFIALPTLILALSVASFAQQNEKSFSQIKIKNFGQMDDRFYRGARPKDRDLKNLADMGVKTIIDLTDNSREYEQPAVEAAGLRYINIPMVDKSSPSMDQINEFLKVANDPETGKFFVHCAGGRHRTGVVGAVYRFNVDGWNLEQALAEMDRYEFNSGYGHSKQKDFVKEYYQQFQTAQAKAAGAPR